jgi:predicted TIM-barrel enzyme
MGRTALEALDLLPDSASGLWTSNAGISLAAADPAHGARLFQEKRAARSGWRGLHFGGVAFKHQEQVSEPALAARLAQPHVDVVTTSGAATGVAAPLAKIAAMKAALGDHPLGVASGVTPENVGQYLGLVDCFLVATGISDSHAELNQARAAELVASVRATDRGHIGDW